MSSSTPWTITANKNVLPSWTETVCISCTNLNSLQTITKDNYIVTQNEHICYSVLAAIGTAPTNPSLTYDAVTTTQSVGDMDTFFTNTDTINCAISSCTMYGSDCSTAYATAYPLTYLSMASSTPWGITATKNINVGWAETICMACTNAIQPVITYNAFTVTQI
jgi:hypothetical protein